MSEGAGLLLEKRMKQIEIDQMFIQDLVSKNELKIERVHKDKNVADLGPKYVVYVDKVTLRRLVKRLVYDVLYVVYVGLVCAFWLQTGVRIAGAVTQGRSKEEPKVVNVMNGMTDMTVLDDFGEEIYVFY